MHDIKVSFIIPAYNEALRIRNTIDAIVDHISNEFIYEVIVVDHGSEDATCDIVASMTATLLLHPGGSIASLRNYGVSYTSGDILVFIDADVLLTASWIKRFREVAVSLATEKQQLTGSWVSIPEDAGWLENCWFRPLQKGKNTHINSGHMVINSEAFEEIGGFNEDLETGEDYEFSMRAQAYGLKIVDDNLLLAVHEGYPKNIKDFFLREFWHGKGDAASLSMFFQSKVAMASVLFLLLHFALILFFYAGYKMGVYISLAGILGLVFVMAFLKYRTESVSRILINSLIYYVYFWARGFSILSLPGIRGIQKRTR